MEVDTGDAVGSVVAASGIWEPNITATVRQLVSPGDVCIDVGAHVGYHTLLMSRLVEEHGHVFAFEPSPARFFELTSNLARNGSTNVTAFNIAAGTGDGEAVLYEAPRENTSASTMSPGALVSPVAGNARDYKPRTVRVAAVESRVPPELFSRIRLVKVDVEGYEVEALRGLEGILSVGAPIAIVVEISPDWSAEDPTGFLEELCARHRLAPWRVVNEYSPRGCFPSKPQPPVRVAVIPSERADLVLVRDMDVEAVPYGRLGSL